MKIARAIAAHGQGQLKDDPDARDIEEITLSYTFHPVDGDKNAS